jgi:hypothetical protein
MPEYRERLWPAPWIFIATALVIPASILVLAPVSVLVGVVTAVVLYGAIVVLALVTAPVIEVGDGTLRAGSASVPLKLVGDPAAHSGDDAFAERGRLLDARAWLMLRGWVGPVVKIPLNDPKDPVPYWLVSSRRPNELVAAIEGSRRPSEG